MEIAGTCSLCSRPSRTLNTCWKCGAIVCETCFDKASGLCIRCSPRRGECREKSKFLK